MATVTKPIALDESINTTEQTPRNIADVLAEELARIAENISPPNAEDIAYDNTESGLTATDVQDAIDEIVSDIPTVNNGTLTIQQNGTSIGSFSANTASNVTANITVPTKVSELTNDSGYTTNTGTVTSVATGTGLTGGTITSSGTISIADHSADYLSGGYLNIHPENTPTLIPFMHNDIAYLLKRGGLAVVKYDGTTQSVDITNWFDASPSYWNIDSTNITTIVVELTLHKVFTYANTIYVDFGSADWRAENVKIEVMNSNYAQDVWTQKYNNTNNSLGHCYVTASHTPAGASGASGGFDKVRFTFSSWNRTRFRIAQIGIYNYGSAGLRETFLPKDGGNVYGTIYPNSNNGADLGTSSKYWDNAYISNIRGSAFLNLCSSEIQCRNFGDTAWAGISASAFTQQSSLRYKENIEDISEDEAEKLLNVRVVRYDYKENVASEDHRFNQHGVIAEEVVDILPEVVTYAIPYGHEEEFDAPVPDGVDYSRFVPYLIKMIQVQQKEIDDLKVQIDDLKRNKL